MRLTSSKLGVYSELANANASRGDLPAATQSNGLEQETVHRGRVQPDAQRPGDLTERVAKRVIRYRSEMRTWFAPNGAGFSEEFVQRARSVCSDLGSD